ncbi:MAG: hypothetical protein MJ192_01800 [Clostridia bacterium]|nr:hypothetical protein [Clostridia bacterium]
MTDQKMNPSDVSSEYAVVPPAAPAAGDNAAPAPRKSCPKWKIVLPIVITAGVLLNAAVLLVAGFFFISDPVRSTGRSLSSLYADVGDVIPDLDDGVTVTADGRLNGSVLDILGGNEIRYTVSAASDMDRNAMLSVSAEADEAESVSLSASLNDDDLAVSFPMLFGDKAVSLRLRTLPDDLAQSALAPSAGTEVSLDEASYEMIMTYARQLADLYKQVDEPATGDDASDDASDAWAEALTAVRRDFADLARVGSVVRIVEVNGRKKPAKATAYQLDNDGIKALFASVRTHIIDNDELIFPEELIVTVEEQEIDPRELLDDIEESVNEMLKECRVTLDLVLYEAFGKLLRVDGVLTETILDRKGEPTDDVLTDTLSVEITPGTDGRLHFFFVENETDGKEEYCDLYIELDLDREKTGDTLLIDLRAPEETVTGKLAARRVLIKAALDRKKGDRFALNARLWTAVGKTEYPDIDTDTASPDTHFSVSGSAARNKKTLSLTLSDLTLTGGPALDPSIKSVSINGQFLALSVSGGKPDVPRGNDADLLTDMSADEIKSLFSAGDDLPVLEAWDRVLNGHLMSIAFTPEDVASVVIDLPYDQVCEASYAPMPGAVFGVNTEFVRYDPSCNRLFVTNPDSSGGKTDINVYDGDTLAYVGTYSFNGNIEAMDAYDGYLLISRTTETVDNSGLTVVSGCSLEELYVFSYFDLWRGVPVNKDTVAGVWVYNGKAYAVNHDQWCTNFVTIDLASGRAEVVSDANTMLMYQPIGCIDRSRGMLFLADSAVSNTNLYVYDLTTGLEICTDGGYFEKELSYFNYQIPYFNGVCFSWGSSFFDGNLGVKDLFDMVLPFEPQPGFSVLWMNGRMMISRVTTESGSVYLLSNENGTVSGTFPENENVLAFLDKGDGSCYLLVTDTAKGEVRLIRRTFTERRAFGPH